MKNLSILFALIASFQTSFAQPDVWENVTSTGFSIPAQNTAPEMEVYDGFLYITTSPLGPGQAKMYRSADGDSGSFSEVTLPLGGDKSIHSFGTTLLEDDFLWCGTGNPQKGGRVYRSGDGESWIPISQRGFGDSSLIMISPHMETFQGSADSIAYLYAGAGSHGGATPGQVWRIPHALSDSMSWTKIVDFALLDTTVKTITYFYTWNGKIYFGTDGGGQLWESEDGTNFSKVTGVGNGFGVPSNKVLASIDVFKDTMYISTNNPVLGGQVWRSGDGVSWNLVTNNAFGKGNEVIEVRSLRSNEGTIWATSYTDTAISSGTPIWRSDDGINWVQSNLDGFGSSANNGQNAVTIEFKSIQYFAGPNYNSGAQVKRIVEIITGTESSSCPIRIYPNPAQSLDDIEFNTCLDIREKHFYNSLGQPISDSNHQSQPGIYFCRVLLSDGSHSTHRIVVE